MRVAPFILALLLVACMRVPSVSQSEAARIEAAANLLLLKSESTEIASDAWPQDIGALNPQSLHVASDGLYIVTSSWFVQEEAGLFVPRHPETFSVSGGDPEYRRLYGAVFSYRIRG